MLQAYIKNTDLFHKMCFKCIYFFCRNNIARHIHKYEAVFGSFMDIGIVVTFLSLTRILSFRL